jgi:hypothetical protein
MHKTHDVCSVASATPPSGVAKQHAVDTQHKVRHGVVRWRTTTSKAAEVLS